MQSRTKQWFEYKRHKKKFVYKTLRLADDYQHEFQEEKEQTSKKAEKKELPEKPTKADLEEINKLVIKKETDIDRDLFKKCFNFQIPSSMLKAVYDTNDKKKNNDLINVIKSGLSDFRKQIEEMDWGWRRTPGVLRNKLNKIVNVVEKINKKAQKDKD